MVVVVNIATNIIINSATTNENHFALRLKTDWRVLPTTSVAAVAPAEVPSVARVKRS